MTGYHHVVRVSNGQWIYLAKDRKSWTAHRFKAGKWRFDKALRLRNREILSSKYWPIMVKAGR